MSTLLEFLDSDADRQGNFAEQEWVHMPEFVQEVDKPYAKIIVRFETKEALKEFGELIGQTVNVKTKSIRYPKLERGLDKALRWVDDDQS